MYDVLFRDKCGFYVNRPGHGDQDNWINFYDTFEEADEARTNYINWLSSRKPYVEKLIPESELLKE